MADVGIELLTPGQGGTGEVSNLMASMGAGTARFDPGMLRPFVDRYGQRCVTFNSGQSAWNEETSRYEPEFVTRTVADMVANGYPIPVANAMSLRKDEWIQLDRTVLKAARSRLRAWGDLAAANPFSGFDGMSKMILEHETMSDPGEALVDMDGLTEGTNDAPRFQLEGLPLPLTHCSFSYSNRKLMASRNSGTPLDVTSAEVAARRVAETVEQTTIGSVTGLTYGNATTNGYGRAPTVYGYTNFPSRITKTNMTVPTGSNGSTVLGDVLAVRNLLYAAKFYGPFMVYTSVDWDVYLDNLFSTTEPSAGTLRSRLKQIDGIQDIRRLDLLTDTFTMIFVQMTQDVAQAVIGMDLTTVQWESKGGFQLNFKTMGILVPQLRADYNGNCGIAHATTA